MKKSLSWIVAAAIVLTSLTCSVFAIDSLDDILAPATATDATATDATATDATDTDATGTDATGTDATGTDATPSDATPSDATETDAIDLVIEGNYIVVAEGTTIEEILAKLGEGSYVKVATPTDAPVAPEATDTDATATDATATDATATDATATDATPTDATPSDAEGTLAKTGMVVVAADGTEYTIVVLGDVDGDGAVKAADARLALRGAVGLENLKGAYAMAADYDNSKTVKAADARLILRDAVGLEDAEGYLAARK